MGWLDSLYCDKKIIERLSDWDNFKLFLMEQKNKLPDIKGYLFLMEITINSIINDTEFLIEGDLYDILHWGEPDEKIDETRELLKSNNQEVAYIRELEGLRKRITKIRMGKSFNEIEFKAILQDLLKKVEEVNLFYFDKITHEINPLGKGKEDWHVVNNIYCVKNYVESSFDLIEEEGNSKITPLFIPGSHYTAMTQQTRGNYYLQHPQINEEIYVSSYSLGLAWLYLPYINNKQLIDNLINAKNWEELHHRGARINDFFDEGFKNKHKLRGWAPDIFKEKYSKKSKKKIKKEILENLGELRLVLRDREIRTINELHNGDYPVIRSLMQVILHGMDFYSDKKNKLEIIEFKTEYNQGEESKYSYAIFLPVGGALWNASEWLFFNEISVENSWETTCDFKSRINLIIKSRKERIDFKKYTVKKQDLISYRKRYDIDFRRRLSEIEQTKSSEGLLVELLGLFYYFQKDKGKIIDFGWHTDPSNKGETDLDAFFISGNLGVIVQSKKSLRIFNPNLESPLEVIEKENFNPLNNLKLKEDLQEIYSHFEKAQKILEQKAKKDGISLENIEKKLFVFNRNEEDYILPELKKELEKNNINLTYFEDIEKDRSLFPKDLIEKINIAFGRVIFDKEED